MHEFISRLGRRWTVAEMGRAYNLTFRNPTASHFVLPDLAEFTHAMDPAPREGDLFMQGRAAGRRDVYLHIAEWLNLTEEELYAIYYQRSILKQGDR